MKKLRYTTNKEQHEYIGRRKEQNLSKALVNDNENWMFDKLKQTEWKWKRQSQWGYRIFDFWCHKLGVAIEVDGPEHDEKYDAYRDEYNFRRSGIVVLRVRNKNEPDANECILYLSILDTWKDRKAALGINGDTKESKQSLSNLPYSYNNSFLKKHLESICNTCHMTIHDIKEST